MTGLQKNILPRFLRPCQTGLPRSQLVEVLLREGVGKAASEQLISLPATEVTKAKNKLTPREQHATTVADACAERDKYI